MNYVVYVRESAIRAGRTFLQVAVGVYTAGIIATQVDSISAFADLTLLDSAVAAGFVATLSFIQNLIEDNFGTQYDKG